MYPYGQNLSIHQTFLPTTFDLAIRQTFLLCSICTHIYIIITLVIFVSNLFGLNTYVV